jgi:hypothetical protein
MRKRLMVACRQVGRPTGNQKRTHVMRTSRLDSIGSMNCERLGLVVPPLPRCHLCRGDVDDGIIGPKTACYRDPPRQCRESAFLQ